MTLSLAFLLLAPAAALPASAASSPQWSLLRKIGRRADDLGASSAGKRLASKADGVLMHFPNVPDRDVVLLGVDGDGFRLFKRGGSPDGLAVGGGEGLAARIRGVAGSPDVEVVLDITAECVGIAADLADEGIDVSFLGPDEEPLDVVTYESGLNKRSYVEVGSGVLAPLGSADELTASLKSLGGVFKASDVGLLGVFEPEDMALWGHQLGVLEPLLRKLEVVDSGDAEARVADFAPHPVLLVGFIDEKQFAALSGVHGGPILAVSPDPDGDPSNFQIAAGLGATHVRGFVEAFVPDSAPLAVLRLGDEGDAWIARTPGEGTPAVTLMAHGLGSSGMRSPVPPLFIASIVVLLFCVPAIRLGEFFSGLVGFNPKAWPRLKFASIGLGPFLPFAERGAIALFGALTLYWTSWALGWILVRVLRRRPLANERQTTVLVGLSAFAATAGILFALNIAAGAA